MFLFKPYFIFPFISYCIRSLGFTVCITKLKYIPRLWKTWTILIRRCSQNILCKAKQLQKQKIKTLLVLSSLKDKCNFVCLPQHASYWPNFYKMYSVISAVLMKYQKAHSSVHRHCSCDGITSGKNLSLAQRRSTVRTCVSVRYWKWFSNSP